jgi:plasmid maintenance system killer protein
VDVPEIEALRANTMWRESRSQLHAATELRVLPPPPGNQLEALRGNRKGQLAIQFNDQLANLFLSGGKAIATMWKSLTITRGRKR